MSTLYFGDNLDVLRERIPDESVDLIYLDPPFNSDANYNAFFRHPSGGRSEAQAEAFHDTWEWLEPAEAAFDDLRRQGGETFLLLEGLRRVVGDSPTMAYLVMMAVRLVELRRVLQPNGSLYLHCDPVASHYLKILLDTIFGPRQFVNEIVWKRSTSHGNTSRNYGSLIDQILFFSKGGNYIWNQQYSAFDESYIRKKFVGQDVDGRRWQSVTLRNPSPRPNLRYSFRASNGVVYEPHPNGWSCDRVRMERYDAEGRLHFPKPGGQLRLKLYLDESQGVRLQNLWTDIPALNSQARERLGYPTQKPVALLERMISTSSSPGATILDPFCGCGTTIEAAQKLDRKWIGVDVTHHAITLIERRLTTKFPGVDFVVEGRPTTIDGARDLADRDKHQFQWWAAWLSGCQVYSDAKKKGADRGIDGNLFFANGPFGTARAIVSVKGGDNVGVQMVRDLRGVIEREGAEMGVFITLAEPTAPMLREAAAAGFVPKSAHGRLPRLQIVTIEELLGGAKPVPGILQPPMVQQAARKRRRKDAAQMELMLPFAGGRAPVKKGDVVAPGFEEWQSAG